MGNPPNLPAELQRALCDVNRRAFRLEDNGEWVADESPGGVIVLQNEEVADLLRLGHIEVTTDSVLVPTDSGRRLYLECAVNGHSRHR